MTARLHRFQAAVTCAVRELQALHPIRQNAVLHSSLLMVRLLLRVQVYPLRQCLKNLVPDCKLQTALQQQWLIRQRGVRRGLPLMWQTVSQGPSRSVLQGQQ